MIDEDLPVITGSGAIVNDGYWVLTNKHVVEDLEYAVVRNGLGEVRDAEEVFMAEEDDLAIIVLAEPFSRPIASIRVNSKTLTSAQMFLCWVIPCQLFLVHSIPQ